jgi:hypothetical protein
MSEVASVFSRINHRLFNLCEENTSTDVTKYGRKGKFKESYFRILGLGEESFFQIRTLNRNFVLFALVSLLNKAGSGTNQFD